MFSKKLERRQIRRVLHRLKRGAFTEKDFERLYKHYYPWVLGALIRWSSKFPRETCEDLTQRTFIKVYENGAKVPTEVSEFQAWLAKVARNEMLNEVEASTRKKRGGTQEDEPVEDDLEDPNSWRESHSALARLLQDERLQELYDSVQRLPAKQQHAIQLYIGGMKISEIAEAMDVAEGTVKAHLHAARKSLERAYKRKDKSKDSRDSS